MSTPAKILVIILFILSMFFVLISLKTADTIDRQNSMITSLLNSSNEQKGAVDSMTQAIGSAKGKIDSQNSEIARINGELESAVQAKNQAESELAQTKEAKTQVEKQLNDAISVGNQLKAQNRELADKVKVLAEVRDRLTLDVNKAREQGAAAIKELNRMKSLIASRPQLWQRIVNPDSPAAEMAPDAGKVFTVKEHGVNAVVFEGNAAVTKGESFSVIRNNEKIGKYVVDDVYRTVVICREKDGRIEGGLQAGDILNP